LFEIRYQVQILKIYVTDILNLFLFRAIHLTIDYCNQLMHLSKRLIRKIPNNVLPKSHNTWLYDSLFPNDLRRISHFYAIRSDRNRIVGALFQDFYKSLFSAKEEGGGREKVGNS